MATKLSTDELLEQISMLTLLEAADLKTKMEEKFGVTAAAPMGAMMMAPAAGGGASEEEAKTEFDAVLASVGDKKIDVLKVVREVTGLGLKEAKELVDSAPKPIKEKVKKEEAEEIKKKLEAIGAKVEIK
ncbi:MAG: 50S ribosomal protein L7/L12 [Cyanobacteria bacterium TGS_CYA1]|nr:50S ribosomal protein L7/L12 [Cyanobacteria bacterium TGS_CYA1]MDX2105418.1 50S ribosomal protein L7/L12 [Candidatus Melainabacteria bacterium]